MNNLLKDNLDTLQYAVKLNGKIVFKSMTSALAENYMNNLPELDKTKATIEVVSKDGKQILLD